MWGLKNKRRNAHFAVVATLGALGLSGCADSLTAVNERGGQRIRAQRATWDALQLDDYVFETRRLCFCGFVGWLEVTVAGDTVQQIVALEAEDASAISHYPTVDELFDILEDAVAQEAAQIEVTWHETMGYPESFFIDYSRNIADEELGHDIRLLSPAT